MPPAAEDATPMDTSDAEAGQVKPAPASKSGLEGGMTLYGGLAYTSVNLIPGTSHIVCLNSSAKEYSASRERRPDKSAASDWTGPAQQLPPPSWDCPQGVG